MSRMATEYDYSELYLGDDRVILPVQYCTYRVPYPTYYRVPLSNVLTVLIWVVEPAGRVALYHLR
jgi:hypothetical protein